MTMPSSLEPADARPTNLPDRPHCGAVLQRTGVACCPQCDHDLHGPEVDAWHHTTANGMGRLAMKASPPVRPAKHHGARIVALVGSATLAWACAGAAGGEPSAIQSYYYFVHWISMSRPDLALEQFADNALVVAGPACTPSSPCVGKEAIQTGYFKALKKGRVSLPVYDQRFDGQKLRARGELTGQGGYPLRRAYVFEFQAGRIASLKAVPDPRNPDTALDLVQLTEKP